MYACVACVFGWPVITSPFEHWLLHVCMCMCMCIVCVRVCVCMKVCMIIISPYRLRHWLRLNDDKRLYYPMQCILTYPLGELASARWFCKNSKSRNIRSISGSVNRNSPNTRITSRSWKFYNKKHTPHKEILDTSRSREAKGGKVVVAHDVAFC